MRVAKLAEANKIEIINEKEPNIILPKDVKVQVKAVGICGTDLHIFQGGRSDVEFPRIMGHELSGYVTEVGSDVTRIKNGDRVVLDPVFACGECPTCKRGFPNVCESVSCYGVQMDGGYKDYIVVDEKHLYTFDKSISYEHAALAEPFSIAANVLERTEVTNEDTVIIIGAGTIGMSIVQVAKSLGAKVMVADIVDSKLLKALELGADKVVNSKMGSVEDVLQEFSPGGANVVIDAVGITPLFEKSIEYAAPRARIACIGFDARPAQISPAVITKKELSIIGSRMNCFQFPKVMEWLNEEKINPSKMISKIYPFEEIQKAFEETLINGEERIKVLITF